MSLVAPDAPMQDPCAQAAATAHDEIVISDDRAVCGAYPALCMMCGVAPATRMDPRVFTWVNPWMLLLLVLGPLGLLWLLGSDQKRTVMVYTCAACRSRSWGLRRGEIAAVCALFVIAIALVAMLCVDYDKASIHMTAVVVIALLAHLLLGVRTGRIWASRMTDDAVVLRLPNQRYASVFYAHLRAPIVEKITTPSNAWVTRTSPSVHNGVRKRSHRVTRRSHRGNTSET